MLSSTTNSNTKVLRKRPLIRVVPKPFSSPHNSPSLFKGEYYEHPGRTPPNPIDWPAHIAAWQESGLPINRYCQQQGLAAHQLSYYKRKFGAINHSSKESTVGGFSRVTVSKAL